LAPDATAATDASGYPGLAEVRAATSKWERRTFNLLEPLSEADLDKPTKTPPKGLEEVFATYGKSFLALASHQMAYRGQIADAVRAARRAAAGTSAGA